MALNAIRQWQFTSTVFVTLPPAQRQPIRAFRRAAGNTIDVGFALHIAHSAPHAFHQAEDNLIAGVNSINQSFLLPQRLRRPYRTARGVIPFNASRAGRIRCTNF